MDSMNWLSDFLDESMPIWRDNPVIYFREVLQFEPDEWQAEAYGLGTQSEGQY